MNKTFIMQLGEGTDFKLSFNRQGGNKYGRK